MLPLQGREEEYSLVTARMGFKSRFSTWPPLTYQWEGGPLVTTRSLGSSLGLCWYHSGWRGRCLITVPHMVSCPVTPRHGSLLLLSGGKSPVYLAGLLWHYPRAKWAWKFMCFMGSPWTPYGVGEVFSLPWGVGQSPVFHSAFLTPSRGWRRAGRAPRYRLAQAELCWQGRGCCSGWILCCFAGAQRLSSHISCDFRLALFQVLWLERAGFCGELCRPHPLSASTSPNLGSRRQRQTPSNREIHTEAL